MVRSEVNCAGRVIRVIKIAAKNAVEFGAAKGRLKR